MFRGVSRWLFAGSVTIVLFWRLALSSLMDPDEAHYAQLTRELIDAGHWLVPLLDGQPYIDKPILFHWLQGAAVVLLGESELAARLPTALAAMALFGITGWLGRCLFGSPVGSWGALMFATMPATFALAGIALLDMVFSAFLFGAMSCLIVAASERRRRLEILGFALLAFAVMTKGPVALVLAALFFGAAWVVGGSLREFIGRLHWPVGLVLAAVAASPWYVWMYFQYGDTFVEGYFIAGNLHYVTQPASFSGRAVSHTFFARVVAGGFFPWSAIAAGRVLDALIRRADPVPVGERVLWLWTLVVIVFFSAARFKLDHYIFPVAPAVALIAAKAWHEALTAAPASSRGVRFSVLVAAAVLVAASTFLSLFIFDLHLELPWQAIFLPMVLAAGGVALVTTIVSNDWRVPRSPMVPVLTMVGAYLVVIPVGYPTLERAKPTAVLARTLKDMTAPDAPAGLYRLEQWRASLRYYAGRPLTRLSSPEELQAFTSSGRPAYIFMIRRDYRMLRKSLGLREVCRSRAIVRTTRHRAGLRRQHWDDLIVVTNAPAGDAKPWMPRQRARWRLPP